MATEDKAYSVSGVTAYLRSLFEGDEVLADLWVEGEISNVRVIAGSGHWYFTLKDETAQLRCALFRASQRGLTTPPRDGDRLRARGRISVYEARGEYQLYVEELQTTGGLGDLFVQLEALKRRLDEEGLFAAERKRELPPFPQRIGVVTSPEAAAFRDVRTVLARRYPLAEIILSPTLVQGQDAPPQIVQALERLQAFPGVELILLVRGGGSIEDLWCFNDERVVRAVANCALPIVTGVGHEIDITLVDYAADLRAPTPSAAAELAVPDQFELRALLQGQQQRLARALSDQVGMFRADLQQQRRNLHLLSPQRRLNEARQRVDDASERLHNAIQRHLTGLRERLQARAALMHSSSPQAILERGYAIVTRSEDGQVVRSEQDAPPGTGIMIRAARGELRARIEDKESHGNYKRTLF